MHSGRTARHASPVRCTTATPPALHRRLARALHELPAPPSILHRHRARTTEAGNRHLDDMQGLVRENATTWRPLVILSRATVE